MKIISWNVNGLRAILKKGFLDFIKKEDPEIICLQEIKANEDQIESILAEYPFKFWNSAEKKGYAGTAIFSKIKPLSQFEEKILNLSEGRASILEFEEFYLINVYVLNSQRGLARLELRKKWDIELLKFLKTLEKKKSVIICGDFNVAHKEIDLANPKENYNKVAGYTQIEIDGFENFIAAGFVDTFRQFDKSPNKYTYWGQWNNLRVRNVGWRIDYFLVSSNFSSNVKNSFILDKILGSDHCPIGLGVAL